MHANNVWNAFTIKTLADYYNDYLKTDILSSVDILEKFISTCLEYYRLDPCHYFSRLGFSWDSMAKMSKIKLQFVSDIDMHLFIGKGMKGGISYIAKRYSNAHNKYITCFNDKKPSKYNMQLDQNNLYGWEMTQYLPYGEFKWLNQNKIDKTDVNSIEENSSTWYLIDVDLEYLDELQEIYNDYPLLLKKLKINHDMLSNYCSDIANECKIKIGKVNRLVPNLVCLNFIEC